MRECVWLKPNAVVNWNLWSERKQADSAMLCSVGSSAKAMKWRHAMGDAWIEGEASRHGAEPSTSAAVQFVTIG
jgi:hypothetical protein